MHFFRYRSVWAMCFGWMFFNTVWYGLLTWMPNYLYKVHGFDIKQLGGASFVIFFAGFVGELVGGYLSDLWKARGGSSNTVYRTLFGVAAVVATVSIFLVSQVKNPLAVVVLLSSTLFFLRWCGLYWVVPSILATRERAGFLGGVMNLGGNIGGISTPIIVGLIVSGDRLVLSGADVLRRRRSGAVRVFDVDRLQPEAARLTSQGPAAAGPPHDPSSHAKGNDHGGSSRTLALVPRLFAACCCSARRAAPYAGRGRRGGGQSPPPRPTCAEARPAEVGVDSHAAHPLSEWIRGAEAGRAQLPRGEGRKARSSSATATGSIAPTITSSIPSPRPSPRSCSASWPARARSARTTRSRPGSSKAHPEFADALEDKQDIELRHLMSMSSGLYYKQVEGTDPLYYSAPNRLQVALTTVAKVPPATQFEYTDANPVLVGAAISTAAGEPEDKFAEERLFKPLGMQNYHWTGADQTGSVSGGWGLRLRAVDMAKLGVVMLHGGQWQGRQVVPQVLDRADVDAVCHRQGLRLLLLDQPHRRDRARVRRHGLQGPVHHRAAEGECGRGDDQHPADRWAVSGTPPTSTSTGTW